MAASTPAEAAISSVFVGPVMPRDRVADHTTQAGRQQQAALTVEGHPQQGDQSARVPE